MSVQTIVTASLEGMRVVVGGKRCELHEYDFRDNRWLPKYEALWPLPGPVADQWLIGWNGLDRSAALSALTGPVETANRRLVAARPGEPHF
jgi:hypothetical protein